MITGQAWFKVPSAIKIELTGKLSKWVSGKDVILHIIGMIGVDGALYRSMEFAGDGVASLSMDDRFSIANMAIEAGAKNGIFPVDEKTIVFGEVGLSGEVRAVNMPEQRVAEAKKLGFETCILPQVCMKMVKDIKGIRLIGVKSVNEAVGMI